MENSRRPADIPLGCSVLLVTSFMANLLDSIDAALFDIGSTLVEGPSISPNKEIVRHFNLAAETAAKIGRLVMCTDFAGPSEVCDALSASGIAVDEDGVDFVVRLWSQQETAAAQINGALEAVKFCVDSGKIVGLLSDIWVPYFRAFERACPEITALAKVKALSFRAGVKKPEPAFHQAAVRALGVPPERILMIGDTYENDIAPAIREGMKTAWILSRAEREVPALVGVINQQLPRPDLALTFITELESELRKEEACVN